MPTYIRSTGNISPQNTFAQASLPENPVEYRTNRLYAIEPDYSTLIDVKLIRRMSRIIKMGVAAALECLKQAEISNPDAIITGTAYGCLEDTGVFLQKMIQNKEEMLTPTSFIQSTHNTIGAQIALLLKCNSYNNTFVHRGFSFETALLDGIMLLEEKTADNVLIGGVDEITDFSFKITSRFGLFKKDIDSSFDLFNTVSRGSIAGEGAAFFLLSNTSSGSDHGILDDVHVFYKPENNKDIPEQIRSFLSRSSFSIADIDVVICGRNGDQRGDAVYDNLQESLFGNIPVINYKQLCGEYPTSTGFALWLAAAIVKTGVAGRLFPEVQGKAIRKVLIYNHSQMIHHSLMLVSAC